MINEKSAKRYCCEDISLIENYEEAIADTTQTWSCHHRRECVNGKFTSLTDLMDKDLYYNRPASELIFLTNSDHCRLHSIGRLHTEEQKNKLRETLSRPDVKKKISDAVRLALSRPEAKKKMSDAKKGKPSRNKGIKLSDETKNKISESTKLAMNDPSIKQKFLDAMIRVRQNPEYLDKLRKSRIGRHWYTDGINNRYVAECPGEGWYLGKTNHKKRS